MTWTLTINQIVATAPTITLATSSVGGVTASTHLDFNITLPTDPAEGDVILLTDYDQPVNLGGPGRGMALRQDQIDDQIIKLLLDPFVDSVHSYKIRHMQPDGITAISISSAPCNFTVSSIAPIISALFKTGGTTTTANFTVTTDQGHGTIYYVVTSTVQNLITKEQIIAGTDQSNNPAIWDGSQVVTAPGAHTDTATGLPTSTVIFLYAVHINALGLASGIREATWGQGYSSWTPVVVGGNLKLWLEASNAGSRHISIGTWVDTWDDLGPHHHNVLGDPTGGTNTKPMYGATFLGGTHPGMRLADYSGNSTAFYHNAFNFESNIATFIFVMQSDTSYLNGRVFSMLGLGSTFDYIEPSMAFATGASDAAQLVCGTTFGSVTTAIPVGSTVAVMIVFDGSTVEVLKSVAGAFVSQGTAPYTKPVGKSTNTLRMGTAPAISASGRWAGVFGTIIAMQSNERSNAAEIYTFLKATTSSIP